MNHAVILHGMPSKEEYYDSAQDSPSNAHWLPWLQRELCIRDILTQTPEMPVPFNPSYTYWKQEFERQEINNSTILIGHSYGAGFLVRWLGESDVSVQKLVLVAPWIDRGNEHGDQFDFAIDTSLVSKTTAGIDILYSTNDDKSIGITVEFLRTHLSSARYHEFVNYGHFCLGDMSTREFPELLNICIGNENYQHLISA